jgi:transcriptional regulator with AAA-type ATPase domain
LQLAVFVCNAAWVHPLPARGDVTIGRARENDLQLLDLGTSRRHAVLHVGEGGIVVERVTRTNRVYLGDAARMGTSRSPARGRREVTDSAEVHLGDTIYLGSCVIEVREKAPPVSRNSGAPTLVPEPPIPAEGVSLVVPPSLHETYEKAYRLAASELDVLIEGETGVGKELLALAMHRRSPRADGPFLRLCCGAWPEGHLESELFGYEKGAFPDAASARPGALEDAHGGTLFLDEVDTMPPSLQGRLRSAIEEGKVFRVGGGAARRVDVRVIAATRGDLRGRVTRGEFAPDLFTLLNGLTFSLPPLRDRAGDIAPLAAAFLADAARASGRAVPALSPQAVAALTAHRWMGNLRELRTVIERALALCPDQTVLPEHCFPPDGGGDANPVPTDPPASRRTVHLLSAETLKEVHRAAVDADLDPVALRERIDPKLVAKLVQEGERAQQLWSDLTALDEAGWLEDGTVPLATWLRNAARLSRAAVSHGTFDDARHSLAPTIAALRLPADHLVAVRDAAIDLHLERRALLARIGPELTASIPEHPDPASQMLADLQALDNAGLVDDAVPLQVWLDTARSLSIDQVQSLVFEQATLILRQELR